MTSHAFRRKNGVRWILRELRDHLRKGAVDIRFMVVVLPEADKHVMSSLVRDFSV